MEKDTVAILFLLTISGGKNMASKSYGSFYNRFFFVFIGLCFLSLLLFENIAEAEIIEDLEENLIINSLRQFDLAEHYFLNGDYYRAAGEYKKFIFFFPENKRAEHAMYKVGLANYNSGHFREAVASFTKLIDKYRKQGFSINTFPAKAYLMMSESYMQLSESGPAEVSLHNLVVETSDTDVKDEAYYRAGWINIETGNWKKAEGQFDSISSQNRDKYRMLQLLSDFEQRVSIPEKSTKLAGIFSIIPGGGMLYCERYRDALTAFLFNTVLICTAYEAFDNGNCALGTLVSIVETGFYTGNFYGAVSSVHKYNKKSKKKFIEKLKKGNRIKLRAEVKKKGVELVFRYAF